MKNKVSSLLVFSIASILLLSSFPLESAFAAVVNESELAGVNSNGSPGTAESIPSTAFTQPEPPTVYPRSNSFTATISGFAGSSDVDFYSFSTIGSGNNVLMADIDDNPFTFDTMLALFDSTGTLIAFDDDSAAELGSASGLDSFIGEIPLAPGNYFIAVTNFPNFPTAFNQCTNFQNLVRPDTSSGGQATIGCPAGNSAFASVNTGQTLPYTLHLSLQADELIGGKILELDHSALMIAGLQINLTLIAPVILSIAGAGIYLLRRK